MVNQIIAHHGIKGQKWGVRRYENEDGTLTVAGKKRYGLNSAPERTLSDSASLTNHSVNARYLKDHASQMSDEQLQKALNRVNMQNQVANLDPTYFEKQKSSMKQLWGDYKKQIITAAVSTAAVTTVAVIANKKLKGHELGARDEIINFGGNLKAAAELIKENGLGSTVKVLGMLF